MLETIIRVQRAINSADDSVEAVMQIVVDQACEATGAPGAVVEIAEGDEMVYRAAAGSLRGTEGLRLPVSGSLSGRAVRTGDVLLSQDTEADDRVDLEACRKVNARSMVVVPLLHADHTGGVLKVVCDRPGAFGEDDVALLEQLAQFIATALRRAAVLDERSRAASVDHLTGLANRSAFLAGLESAIIAAAMSQHVTVVLYLDLDGFKPINDTHGHAVGDEVLRLTGQRIAAAAQGAGLVARIGGDEFAVLLIAASVDDVHDLRERLISEVRADIPVEAGVVRVGVSCGMAVISGEDLAEAVLARADAAMYADKRTKALSSTDAGSPLSGLN